MLKAFEFWEQVRRISTTATRREGDSMQRPGGYSADVDSAAVVCKICSVSPQEQIAEDAIRAALARGEEKSEALRQRRGKPIDLDAYFATPPELRMAFSTLKGADVAPEELELLKEINRLEEQAKSAANEKRRSELRLKISELRAVYDMKMQAYRRAVTGGKASAVKGALKGALDR